MVKHRNRKNWELKPFAGFDFELDQDKENEYINIYEKGSWDVYERTLTALANEMSRDDAGAYLPDPREIDLRKQVLAWMNACGFSQQFICLVLQQELISFELITQLIKTHTAPEIEILFEWEMLEYPNEYDDGVWAIKQRRESTD